MTNSLLQAQNISLAIDGKQILQNINLQIDAKRIVTLIGPNGAGKTTLVKIVLGLLAPSAGKVNLRNNLRIGYMPQRLHVDNSMPISVQKFLHLAVRAKPELIEKVLDEVKAAHLLHSQIHSLSGGELQRVLLARSLIQDPELLVLDEPVQGVDINGQAELYALIASIRDSHQCGILIVSHDLHLVMSATDEVICLNQHVCCHGHPEQVSNDPAYLELFGKKQAASLAVYAHHHNHSHSLDGEVVNGEALNGDHSGHDHG
ncbi:MAG: zinc ABC transporter ATP-binding protein ZnuC [Gammaproteobacteria bacterium]|nr:zinc ABC transporter ATP-binding protein ZnuC [Gammaproteobacteria bacterium]